MDMDAAVAGASFSGLGLALLLRDSGSSVVAELVFKPFAYSSEASMLMAAHLKVCCVSVVMKDKSKQWHA